uniref:Dynein heavy chain, cytoplasmic n=1 Tax=Panagrolaimus davidi TaxID=227884 RepID=A0A914QGZ1_9BILA
MLITDLVHKRDFTRELVSTNTDFQWLQAMKFYFVAKEADPFKCCVVKMANAEFFYGFEYLGIQEKLVQTPLTDRCYLTMTQALHSRLGGGPFGPAGTDITESVKALGQQLGRFAVGRILVALCQVGAWSCFDDINLMEERMLSAVSQQIQTIQENVRAGGDSKITIVGKNLSVNLNMAIFITMNPGYSGRSNLPDNLKQLFRSLAMTQPDQQLSNQYHYDFGLRALKYVLGSAGNIKRDQIQRMKEEAVSKGENVAETDMGDQISEQQILIQSVYETLKLVSEDITLFKRTIMELNKAKLEKVQIEKERDGAAAA